MDRDVGNLRRLWCSIITISIILITISVWLFMKLSKKGIPAQKLFLENPSPHTNFKIGLITAVNLASFIQKNRETVYSAWQFGIMTYRFASGDGTYINKTIAALIAILATATVSTITTKHH